MARGEILPLRPFSYASDTDRDRWAALLLRFSEEMHLVDGEPDRLLEFADPLHALTAGRIGNLRRVLSRALSVAIDEKPTPDAPEVIVEEHIFRAAGAGAVRPQAGRKKGGRKKGGSAVA
ncbi:hypothetical protein [Rhodococcus sp. H29-C3]|uniref:hypothetical protein n=1 Tax=Rhodococcus sp. H29-C3 TaxID=3046307 RepID=UPI0024BBD025|nr:hypothetical protein [Rhodococcus sp. H29-C3]MDJ0362284.1 hypothetical protein [Rhodococcus sp. H29-C3]